MATKISQILRSDRIGQLSESGGTITLGPSTLTIGGVQATTDSNVTVSADLSAPNIRRQVYAVLSGGAVQLVTSANENSSGPTGYAAWKLVGSYWTTNASGFGGFLEISGRSFAEGSFTVAAGSITAPGTGSVTTDATGLYTYKGKTLQIDGSFGANLNTGINTNYQIPLNLLPILNILGITSLVGLANSNETGGDSGGFVSAPATNLLVWLSDQNGTAGRGVNFRAVALLDDPGTPIKDR